MTTNYHKRPTMAEEISNIEALGHVITVRHRPNGLPIYRVDGAAKEFTGAQLLQRFPFRYGVKK